MLFDAVLEDGVDPRAGKSLGSRPTSLADDTDCAVPKLGVVFGWEWAELLAPSGAFCFAAAETPVRRQTDKSGRAVAEDSSATVAGRYFALDDWALLGTPASRSSGPSHSCLDTEAETSLQFREKGQDLGGVVVVVDLSVV